ncbi:hypothetical protein F0562_032692 [Nyssa sinensis]|uniref:non-specific serine/threonine protein kinase n=1 Tax=Nyssa sinensis TaxID=561372 RepID=A0A5J5AQU2_9ASTE|nr:hypothetical protein F0562_032692 [Nyssa sinensis]
MEKGGEWFNVTEMAQANTITIHDHIFADKESAYTYSLNFEIIWELFLIRGCAVGTAASTAGIGLLIIILALCFRRKFSLGESMGFWKKKTENYRDIKAFLRNYGSLAPKMYSYVDVKKMTDSFKCKLGKGGYGCVYKGILHISNVVAVKVLNGSKGSGEEFINEVASISRTSHVNIVTLLGFCFEGSKRALIYEFLPNGSLEKFIYDCNSMTNHQLGWETLYQIAVGIAQGLEYLH